MYICFVLFLIDLLIIDLRAGKGEQSSLFVLNTTPMKCQASECFCTDFNRTFCKNYRADDKPKKIGLRKTSMKKRYKPTGEMDLFKHLWGTRKHTCYITGRELEFSPSICFHILGKGAFPAYRLNPSNIIFVNAEYHTDWHTMSREKLLKKDRRWEYVFKLYEMLKIAYYSEGL